MNVQWQNSPLGC